MGSLIYTMPERQILNPSRHCHDKMVRGKRRSFCRSTTSRIKRQKACEWKRVSWLAKEGKSRAMAGLLFAELTEWLTQVESMVKANFFLIYSLNTANNWLFLRENRHVKPRIKAPISTTTIKHDQIFHTHNFYDSIILYLCSLFKRWNEIKNHCYPMRNDPKYHIKNFNTRGEGSKQHYSSYHNPHT